MTSVRRSVQRNVSLLSTWPGNANAPAEYPVGDRRRIISQFHARTSSALCPQDATRVPVPLCLFRVFLCRFHHLLDLLGRLLPTQELNQQCLQSSRRTTLLRSLGVGQVILFWREEVQVRVLSQGVPTEQQSDHSPENPHRRTSLFMSCLSPLLHSEFESKKTRSYSYGREALRVSQVWQEVLKERQSDHSLENSHWRKTILM